MLSDQRLDSTSATAWYGVADPQSFDGVEISYLGGKPEPSLEQAKKFTVDGTTFKVRIDVAAKALDWRTLARNPGP